MFPVEVLDVFVACQKLNGFGIGFWGIEEF